MIKKYSKGKVFHIQGLECCTPPVGYVRDFQKETLKYVGVYTRSDSEKNQYWQRIDLPKNWESKRESEEAKRKVNRSFVDPELEEFRRDAWMKRYEGMWFMNNGVPTYITGLHYYYLNWVYIGGQTNNNGYPDYWESDRDFFYFLDYAMQDNSCFGVVYLTRRRSGKTAKSVAFLLEACTRIEKANGGIQSKTEYDARNVVFKGVREAFLRLPDFFQPKYRSSGIEKKIKLDDGVIDEEPRLKGEIDFQSSGDKAYDGFQLKRYVGDEIFKTENSDIVQRHEIVLPCLYDQSLRPYGKALYTSTVEEIKGEVQQYMDFWENSNQLERDPVTGFTKSKMFRFFLPAQDSMNRDIYGKCNSEKNLEFIMAERNQVKNRPALFNGRVRKNPTNVEEAFRVSASNKVYDTARLLDRHENISWRDDLYETGNFIWKGGEKDTEVIWVPASNGRWKVRWQMIDGSTLKRPSHIPISRPWNDHRYTMGCDPYSHSRTQDYRNSNGAFYVYRKSDIGNPDQSEAFVVEYCARPATSNMFFEDVIKTCVFFGCEVLIENNRNNIMDYMEYREYMKYAMKVKGRKSPGIPTTQKTIEDIIAVTEAYIHNYLDRVYFSDLTLDWANFDPNNTTRFDRAMAAGMTLLANDRYKVYFKKKDIGRMYDVKELIR